jgi:hypothetical protein
LKKHPVAKHWYNWDDVESGQVELPYGHVRMTKLAWEQGLKKYFPKRPKLDSQKQKDLTDAFKWVDAHFGSYMRNSRVVDHEEVLEDVNMKSSTGFPARLLFPRKGNAYKEPLVLDFLENYWEDCASPNCYATYYTASLKDEFRPREKIDAHKTRVFSAASFESSWVCARLFKDQRERMQDSLFKSVSAIGIRQTNLDFNELWEQLREHENCGMLDANNWDGSILADMMIHCALLRFSWLRRSDRTLKNFWRVMNIYRDAIFAYLLFPDGSIFREDGGMPSGWGLTADDNTLMHLALLAYNCIRRGLSYEQFCRCARVFLYGDDNTYSYDNEVSDVFAPANLAECSREVGIDFEIPEKGGWENLIFLQHYFLQQNYHGKTYRVGVRAFQPILCGWLQEGDGSWETAVERSCAYRIQSFFHPELFEVITSFIDEMLRTHDPKDTKGFRSMVLSVSELEELYFSKDMHFFTDPL